MNEISTGLDSSTIYQIVKMYRKILFVKWKQLYSWLFYHFLLRHSNYLMIQYCYPMDIYLVHQGPREGALDFFNALGFQLPPCKGIADFFTRGTQLRINISIELYIQFLKIKQLLNKTTIVGDIEKGLSTILGGSISTVHFCMCFRIC